MRQSIVLSGSLLAATILFTTGCPPKGGGGDGGGPVKLEEVSGEIASIFCDVADTCFGGFFGGGADCEARFAAEFDNTQLPQWQAAVERGTLNYDAAKMRECLDAFRAGGCDIFASDDPPAACDEALAGTVDVGGACYIEDECLGGAYCDTNAACPGACVAYLAAGADCSGQGRCGSGLDCVGGVCAAYATEGQPCRAGKPSCAGRLDCQGATAENPGTCVAPPAPTTAALGATCDPEGSIFCESGLSCVMDSIDTTTQTPVWLCAAASTAGGACKMGIPDPCPTDQYCSGLDIGAGVLEGTCGPLPGEGQACVDTPMGSGCQGSLECNWNTNVCFRKQANGGACTEDQTCISGYCDPATSLCVVPECG